MKPQVLFELTNLNKPLAWIRKLAFVSIIKRPHGTFFYLESEPECLIWKPELFQPRMKE